MRRTAPAPKQPQGLVSQPTAQMLSIIEQTLSPELRGEGARPCRRSLLLCDRARHAGEKPAGDVLPTLLLLNRRVSPVVVLRQVSCKARAVAGVSR